jgi:CTP synthase
MQTACIEFARNACDLKDADSTEFNVETPHPIIFKLRDLVNVEEMGGTMRLGAWICTLSDGSLAQGSLRRRHRDQRTPPPPLRIQPRYRDKLEKGGLVFSGISTDGKFVEIVELAATSTPGSSAANSIPEFKSKPLAPHPLFASFVQRRVSE